MRKLACSPTSPPRPPAPRPSPGFPVGTGCRSPSVSPHMRGHSAGKSGTRRLSCPVVVKQTRDPRRIPHPDNSPSHLGSPRPAPTLHLRPISQQGLCNRGWDIRATNAPGGLTYCPSADPPAPPSRFEGPKQVFQEPSHVVINMHIALGATCGGDRHTRGARFRLASPSPPPQMRRGVNTWAFRLGHVAGRPPPSDSSTRTQPTAASPGTGARGRRGRQRRQCCVGGEGRRAVGAASPEPGPRGRAPFRSLLAVATSSGTVARSCFCCFTEGRGSLSLIILRVGRPHPRRAAGAWAEQRQVPRKVAEVRSSPRTADPRGQKPRGTSLSGVPFAQNTFWAGHGQSAKSSPTVGFCPSPFSRRVWHQN